MTAAPGTSTTSATRDTTDRALVAWSVARALLWQTLRAAYGIGRGGRRRSSRSGCGVRAPAGGRRGGDPRAHDPGRSGRLRPRGRVTRSRTTRRTSTCRRRSSCCSVPPGARVVRPRSAIRRPAAVLLPPGSARPDYAIARLGGLLAGLRPDERAACVLLFGAIFAATDPVSGLAADAPDLPRSLAISVLTAGLLGGVSAVIAAWTPRRAYATAAIIGAVRRPADRRVAERAARLPVASRGPHPGQPGDLLDGANSAIFGSIPDSPAVAAAGLPAWMYLAAAAIGIAASSCSSCGATCGSRYDLGRRLRHPRPRPLRRGPRRSRPSRPSRSTTSRAGTATSWPSTTSRSRSARA